MLEQNPLVASGEYVRVYASEVCPGEITTLNEEIVSMEPDEGGRDRVKVVLLKGGDQRSHYCRGDSTMLVRATSVPRGESGSDHSLTAATVAKIAQEHAQRGRFVIANTRSWTGRTASAIVRVIDSMLGDDPLSDVFIYRAAGQIADHGETVTLISATRGVITYRDGEGEQDVIDVDDILLISFP